MSRGRGDVLLAEEVTSSCVWRASRGAAGSWWSARSAARTNDLDAGAEGRKLRIDDVGSVVRDVSRHQVHTVSPWFVRAGSSAAEACLRRPAFLARMVWSGSSRESSSTYALCTANDESHAVTRAAPGWGAELTLLARW